MLEEPLGWQGTVVIWATDRADVPSLFPLNSNSGIFCSSEGSGSSALSWRRVDACGRWKPARTCCWSRVSLYPREASPVRVIGFLVVWLLIKIFPESCGLKCSKGTVRNKKKGWIYYTSNWRSKSTLSWLVLFIILKVFEVFGALVPKMACCGRVKLMISNRRYSQVQEQ